MGVKIVSLESTITYSSAESTSFYTGNFSLLSPLFLSRNSKLRWKLEPREFLISEINLSTEEQKSTVTQSGSDLLNDCDSFPSFFRLVVSCHAPIPLTSPEEGILFGSAYVYSFKYEALQNVLWRQGWAWGIWIYIKLQLHRSLILAGNNSAVTEMGIILSYRVNLGRCVLV